MTSAHRMQTAEHYKESGYEDALYHELVISVGVLNGTEIEEMMGRDYSTVSLGRKRLREKLKSRKHLSQIIKRVEVGLSIIKN